MNDWSEQNKPWQYLNNYTNVYVLWDIHHMQSLPVTIKWYMDINSC